ncbi:MAG TPA: TetR/AcrR family transcriptional regulator, partial [Ktedonobacterales bacterium]|nr:TetR/AcrR family transcriptional regulator [Ktedonobacterales bacterium]
MAEGRRQKQHLATVEEIKQIARRHMREQGTAAISLRSIAKELGVTPPALYRYFDSRDDLITALILDAYHALAEALAAARDAAPADDPAARLLAACLEYRDWALVHPVDYELIFGNPIPGYSAPSALTQPAARLTMRLFVGVVGEALKHGGQIPAEYEAVRPDMKERLDSMRQAEGYAVPPTALLFVLAVWARMQGMITLELFGHL